MAKIVYNSCYGGFGLSKEALKRYKELSGKTDVYNNDIERDDPHLVAVVEEMGEAASGSYSELRIKTVAAGVLWRIDEYDGNETVCTMDDYEWKVAKD